ncbi:MAG: pyroglutamyl-peptidase I [Lachnospiraceae bacterium]|nr:pyroglutamyl-peptidase I [Lachnospiraceae bacterium]
MKVLVTGFEPFGGQTVNSSASAVALLPENLGGHTIVKAILPVSYTRSDKILLAKIRECQPDIVICVGQNAGVSTIRVESTAGNYAHAESEDNDHNLWLYRSIEMSGAPSYRATLPIEKIVKNLGNAGIPAEVSHSAGTFVCNCLMYQMLRMQETEFPSASCGFVHVPCLPEQCADPAKDPCMSVEQIVKALCIAIATTIDPESDGILAEAAPAALETAAAETAPVEAPGTAAPVAAVPVEAAAETVAAATTAAVETVTAAPAAAAIAAAAAPAEPAAPAAEPAPAAPKENGMSAAAAAAAYFGKIRKERAKQQDEDDSMYYNRPTRKPEKPAGEETKADEVLRRISGSVPEKIETLGEAPRETLYAPPQERYKVDTSDYRVFAVKEKYKGAFEPDGTEKMTLTEYMETFIPERQKTAEELREEEKRMLIHKTETRDERSYEERAQLRKEAARKEAEKEHDFFGDLFVMSDTMRAMGKTLNKSVMVDGEIYMLLYTSIEENGAIVSYKIREQSSTTGSNGRTLGVLPVYATEYEKYYLFRAITENKVIVCDPETYEIRLEEEKQ